MSAFNILVTTLPCPHCHETEEFAVQFKYGSIWQLKYKIGDVLKWGGSQVGDSSYKQVVCEGIAGPCSKCGEDNIDIDVFVVDGVIQSTRPHNLSYDFEKNPLGDFLILDS